MRFSIIIVTLNAGSKLEETVKSALSQTYKDYEILIKDGASNDGSLDFLKELNAPNIRVVSRKDTSIYDAMNQAVSECLGDYYIFMNTGDLFASNKVLAAVAKYQAGHSSDIIYGDMRRSDQDVIIPYPDRLTDFGLYRNVPCHQVCFYNKRLFSQRGYDTSFKVRSDYEHFLWSVYKCKAKTSHIALPICIYEGGGYSETKENLKVSAREHKLIVRKYQGSKSVIYDAIMIITLQPLRKLMAESPVFGRLYQGIKGIIYGKKD